MNDRIEIFTTPLDPYAALRSFTNDLGSQKAVFGAESHFIGTLRHHNEGSRVESLWLEHYPGMTENELHRIVLEERQRLNFGPALICHRVGHLTPGETIVVVATWSEHRAASLQGTEALIERLKHEAPFWKREEGSEGARWITRNTPGRP